MGCSEYKLKTTQWLGQLLIHFILSNVKSLFAQSIQENGQLYDVHHEILTFFRFFRYETISNTIKSILSMVVEIVSSTTH